MSNDNNAPAPEIPVLLPVLPSASPSLSALMEEKLANAKQRFLETSKELGCETELAELTVNDVLGHLLTLPLPEELLRAKETEFFLELVESSVEEENAEATAKFVSGVRNLPPEQVQLAWRYVHFFMDCLKAIKAQ